MGKIKNLHKAGERSVSDGSRKNQPNCILECSCNEIGENSQISYDEDGTTSEKLSALNIQSGEAPKNKRMPLWVKRYVFLMVNYISIFASVILLVLAKNQTVVTGDSLWYFIVTSICIIITFSLAVFRLMLKKEHIEHPVFRSLKWLFYFGTPAAACIILESFGRNPFETSGMEIRIFVLNIIFWYLISFIVLTVTKSSGAAAFVTTFLALIFGICNYYTEYFRGIPIYPWDFASVGVAAKVANNYTFIITPRIAMLVSLALFMVQLSVIFSNTIKIKWGGRQLSVIAVLVLTLFGYCTLVQSDDLAEEFSLNTTLFTPVQMNKDNGITVTFLSYFKYLKVSPPDGYKPERLYEMVLMYNETGKISDEPFTNTTNDWSDTYDVSERESEDTSYRITAAGDIKGELAVSEVIESEGDRADIIFDTDKVNSEETASEDGENLYGQPQDSMLISGDDTPNIIVIMNETWSDPSVFGDYTTYIGEDIVDCYETWHSLEKNTIKGYAYSSVKGGNTANSEFEFLTGMSMANLPIGSVAYQQYVNSKTPSLVSQLSSLGYKTIGMHPYYSGGWEREDVYKYFGFDETYFIEDFDGMEMIRSYYSDRSTFRKIIELYENKQKDEKLFIFDITMQNHGFYDTDYDNFDVNVKVDGSDYFDLQLYMSLMKETDTAFSELISYFEEAEEDTVILMFGDHQPSDWVYYDIREMNGVSNSENTDLETQQMKYIVPYIVWANYDIGAQNTDEFGTVSINYLSSLMLDKAGIETTPAQKMLLKLNEKYPVITSNCIITSEGEFIPSSNMPENDGFLLYSMIQYNLLFDSKNRDERVYSPGGVDFE